MSAPLLPDPLSSRECDLRGYDFMPLFGTRLFGSEVYSIGLEKPRAFMAAMKLWWEAWQQCPAGSLPADDRTLCRLADLGTDLRTWRHIRDVAMHGFILCNDGRYYHPILSEEAELAFKRRKKERDKKTAYRQAKSNGPKGLAEIVPGDVPEPVPIPVPVPVPVPVPADRTGQDRESLRQQPDSVLSRDAAAEDAVVPIRLKLSDPPGRWLAETREREKVFDPATGKFAEVACAGSCQDVRGAALDICLAAGMDPASHCDWRPLIRWLEAGADFAMDLMPEVRKRAARPDYTPPSTLAYYDDEMMRLAVLRREEPERLRLEAAYYDRLKTGGIA